MIKIAPNRISRAFDALIGRKPSTRSRAADDVSRVTAAMVRARYDAANQGSLEYGKIWENADNLDANSANSYEARKRLRANARYEVGNNGYADGIVSTHANYVVGAVGPKLRLINYEDEDRAQQIERDFDRHAKLIHLRKKLWSLCHAKVQDGEAFSMAVMNERLLRKTSVLLDLHIFETDLVHSPHQTLFFRPGEEDGVRFDRFGNPIAYSILRRHPGSSHGTVTYDEADWVDADFVFHWFRLRRPGTQRQVSELKSTLNVGAGSRRYREAVLAAAETAADFTVLLKTQQLPDVEWDMSQAEAWTQTELSKRMLTAIPAGYDAEQMKAEQPTQHYNDFARQQINEQGRPKSMPVNVSMSDSSQHNFASGKLDHQPWFAEIAVDRADCDESTLTPFFELYWPEYLMATGSAQEELPDHVWDWPVLPVADERARAIARGLDLANGSTSLSEVWSDKGKDYEKDVLPQMAKDFGVSTDEMRGILTQAIFNAGVQADESTPSTAQE